MFDYIGNLVDWLAWLTLVFVSALVGHGARFQLNIGSLSSQIDLVFNPNSRILAWSNFIAV